MKYLVYMRVATLRVIRVRSTPCGADGVVAWVCGFTKSARISGGGNIAPSTSGEDDGDGEDAMLAITIVGYSTTIESGTL